MRSSLTIDRPEKYILLGLLSSIAECDAARGAKKEDLGEVEHELTACLVQVYLNESPFSIRRLLAADVKVSVTPM
jgi:hypothetical protein